MPIPLRIAARGAALSAAEKSSIEALAFGLEGFFPRILSCEVHVDGPGGHHRHGTFHVRIRLAVPTRSIVISRQKGAGLQEVLVEAFRSAGRRLEDHARRVRGDVKRRSGSKEGRVVRVFPDEGFGFLESSGREIYFHRHSVLSPGFGRLAVGTRVRFAEEPGIDGPQASTISIIGPKRAARHA
jgi:cold shock CspA family protein